MAEPRPGYELPLLLLGGFRSLIDELHRRLATEGHPDLRPAYGFALQAIGAEGATATEVGARLGVSKQAAGKTIDRLMAMGYAERRDDPDDGRRRIVALTDHGRDALARSAAIFDDLRDDWAKIIGSRRLATLQSDLRRVTPESFPVDIPGWFTG